MNDDGADLKRAREEAHEYPAGRADYMAKRWWRNVLCARGQDMRT